jgi:hypothetical protein
VDPRAGLDDVENRKFLTLPGLELLPLGRPVRSQSLYRLRCPGSMTLTGRCNRLHERLDVLKGAATQEIPLLLSDRGHGSPPPNWLRIGQAGSDSQRG